MRGTGILRVDRRHNLSLGVLAVSAFFVFSSAAIASETPTVESESVSGVSEHDATLEAQIETGGLYTGYQFEIDTNPSYNFTRFACPFSFPNSAQCMAIIDGEPLPAGLVEPDPRYIQSGSGDQSVSLDLASIGATLQPGTTYHYRVTVSNGTHGAQGLDQAFVTSSMGATRTAPSIDSVSVSNVTEHDATLEAQINPHGLETTYEFNLASPACQSDWPMVGPCFAISGFPLPSATLPAGFGDQTVRLDINTAGKTLLPGTWYEYAVTASNAEGKVIGHNAGEGPGIGRNFAGGGGEQNFKTLAANLAPSEVVTEPAEATPTGYKLAGKLNPGGLPTTYYFEYIGDREAECLGGGGLNNCRPETAPAGPIEGDTQGQIAPIEVRQLTPGETYRYWLVASNSKGTVRGNEMTFTTASEQVQPLVGEEKPPSTEKPSSTSTAGGGKQSGLDTQPGSGSPSPSPDTPTSSTGISRPLTKAQKLVKALGQCKKDKSKRKRVACEKRAQKKYGSAAKKHKAPGR